MCRKRMQHPRVRLPSVVDLLRNAALSSPVESVVRPVTPAPQRPSRCGVPSRSALVRRRSPRQPMNRTRYRHETPSPVRRRRELVPPRVVPRSARSRGDPWGSGRPMPRRSARAADERERPNRPGTTPLPEPVRPEPIPGICGETQPAGRVPEPEPEPNRRPGSRRRPAARSVAGNLRLPGGRQPVSRLLPAQQRSVARRNRPRGPHPVPRRPVLGAQVLGRRVLGRRVLGAQERDRSGPTRPRQLRQGPAAQVGTPSMAPERVRLVVPSLVRRRVPPRSPLRPEGHEVMLGARAPEPSPVPGRGVLPGRPAARDRPARGGRAPRFPAGLNRISPRPDRHAPAAPAPSPPAAHPVLEAPRVPVPRVLVSRRGLVCPPGPRERGLRVQRTRRSVGRIRPTGSVPRPTRRPVVPAHRRAPRDPGRRVRLVMDVMLRLPLHGRASAVPPELTQRCEVDQAPGRKGEPIPVLGAASRREGRTGPACPVPPAPVPPAPVLLAPVLLGPVRPRPTGRPAVAYPRLEVVARPR